MNIEKRSELRFLLSLVVGVLGCGDDGSPPAGSGGQTDTGSGTTGSSGTTIETTASTDSSSDTSSGAAGESSSSSGSSGSEASTGDGSGLDCAAFCALQTSCSDFPIRDCVEHCEWTYDNFDFETDACRAAVVDAFDCMTQQACSEWSQAMLPDGACGAAVAAQGDHCLGAGLFAGWDSCVLLCRYAVAECAVDVPGGSTYLDEINCHGECKLNRLYEAELGCVAPALDYHRCLLGLDCAPLEAHLNGDQTAAPACTQAAQSAAAACDG